MSDVPRVSFESFSFYIPLLFAAHGHGGSGTFKVRGALCDVRTSIPNAQLTSTLGLTYYKAQAVTPRGRLQITWYGRRFPRH